MTATAATANRKLTSGSTRWRAKPNVRRARKLDRESRQTNWSNIFRWYRAGWGRYTQADPISFLDNAAVPIARRQNGAVLHLYDYVSSSPMRGTDPLGLWGIAPANPNINTIICDGSGGITAQIPRPNRCTGGCTLAHEYSHRADALAASPNICQGQPYGVIPGFTTWEEEKTSEGKAFATSIACLQERLDAGGDANGCCDDALRRQRDAEKDYARQKGYLP